MSAYAAVNLIAEDGQVEVLTHRWGGGAFEDIIPQIMDAGRAAADTKTMAANLIVIDDDFTPETVTETDLSTLLVSQRDNNLLSYNLYLRKGGWDIEVWSNGGYALVEAGEASLTICPIRTNAQVIITRRPLEKLSKRITRAATAMREKESDRVIAEYREVFAMYAVGEVGEGETGDPFVFSAGPNAHIERLKEHCTKMGGRPVGYVTVRLKNGKPFYMCTYFFPKNAHCNCGQAGCPGGGVHEPKNARDVSVMMAAIDYIKKGSNDTGILPAPAEAEKNFAAKARK